MFFSVITKNLNQEILTQNLVTFKRWDGVKNKKLWGLTRKSNFQGEGFTKNQYIRGNCLKREAWTVFRFKSGLGKKEGVFLRGLIPQYTLYSKEFMEVMNTLIKYFKLTYLFQYFHAVLLLLLLLFLLLQELDSKTFSRHFAVFQKNLMQTSELLSPLKSSGNLLFSNDFRGVRS